VIKQICLLFLILLAGCRSQEKPPSNTLRISFSCYPSTMDPRKSGDFTSSTLICLVFDGLTRCLPDGSPENALAEKIDISKDQLTYTFHLRPSTWSDGHAVTAFDFEQSWKQALDPKLPSVCAYLFYPIKNAEKAVQNLVELDEVGIRAIDDLTLEVTLERPTPYFLSLTSFPSFLPVPQHRVAEMDGIISKERTINGPYTIKKAVFQSLIILEKNKNYWNADALKIEEIQIHIINSESTAYHMFECGELDWIGGILAPISPDALSAVKDRAIYTPMSASTFFTFNTVRPPFNNLHLRKAFCMAIDRHEIAREILPQTQIIATRCIPPSLAGGENRDILPSFDPEQAKIHLQLGLQEVGETVESLSPVILHFRSGIVDRNIAQIIQRKWKDILGVDVLLVETDFKTHKEILHARKYEVAIANWVAQYHDPANILERFKTPTNAKNYPAWNHPQYAHLIQQLQQEFEPQKRRPLIEQAEDLLAQELPILPIYHWSSPSLCSQRLQNMQTTPSGGVLFERSYLVN
jgi:oligopeptide transport system substrate-binding protein